MQKMCEISIVSQSDFVREEARTILICIENSLARLDKDSKQKLFDIIIILLEDDEKPSIREMAAILCSRFITQEKQGFMPRIKIILPILFGRLNNEQSKCTWLIC